MSRGQRLGRSAQWDAHAGKIHHENWLGAWLHARRVQRNVPGLEVRIYRCTWNYLPALGETGKPHWHITTHLPRKFRRYGPAGWYQR